jgi:hypothetical protein
MVFGGGLAVNYIGNDRNNLDSRIIGHILVIVMFLAWTILRLVSAWFVS